MAQGYLEIKLIDSGQKIIPLQASRSSVVLRKSYTHSLLERFSKRCCSPLLLHSSPNSGGLGLPAAVLDDPSVCHRTATPMLGKSVMNLSASRVPARESGSNVMPKLSLVWKRVRKAARVNPVHLESTDH